MNEYTILLLIFHILMGGVYNLKMEKTKMIVIGSKGYINDNMYMDNPFFGERRDHNFSWNSPFNSYGIPYDYYKISYNNQNIYPGSINAYNSKKCESEIADKKIIQTDIGHNGSKYVYSDSETSDFNEGYNYKEINLSDQLSDQDVAKNVNGVTHETSEISPEFKGPIFENYRHNYEMFNKKESSVIMKGDQTSDYRVNHDINLDYPVNVVILNPESKEPSYDTLDSLAEQDNEKEVTTQKEKQQIYESQDDISPHTKDTVIDKEFRGPVFQNYQDNSQSINKTVKDFIITKDHNPEKASLNAFDNIANDNIETSDQVFNRQVLENSKDTSQSGVKGKDIYSPEIDKEIVVPIVDSQITKEEKINDFNLDITQITQPSQYKEIPMIENNQQNLYLCPKDINDLNEKQENELLEEFKQPEYKYNKPINDFTTPENIELYEISHNKGILFDKKNQVEINKEFRGPVFDIYKSNNSMEKSKQQQEKPLEQNVLPIKVIVDNNFITSPQLKKEVKEDMENLENKSEQILYVPFAISNLSNIFNYYSSEDNFIGTKENTLIKEEFRGPVFDNYKENIAYLSGITQSSAKENIKSESDFESPKQEQLSYKEFIGPVFDNIKQPFEIESTNICEISDNKHASENLFEENGQYQTINQEFRGPVFENYKENAQYISGNTNEFNYNTNFDQSMSKKEIEHDLISDTNAPTVLDENRNIIGQNRNNLCIPETNVISTIDNSIENNRAKYPYPTNNQINTQISLPNSNDDLIHIYTDKNQVNQKNDKGPFSVEPSHSNESPKESNIHQEEVINNPKDNSLESSTVVNKQSNLDSYSLLNGKNDDKQFSNEILKTLNDITPITNDFQENLPLISDTNSTKNLNPPKRDINKQNDQKSYLGNEKQESDTNSAENLGLNNGKDYLSKDSYDSGKQYPFEDNPQIHTENSYTTPASTNKVQLVNNYSETPKNYEIPYSPLGNSENSLVIKSPQSPNGYDVTSPLKNETQTETYNDCKVLSSTYAASTGNPPNAITTQNINYYKPTPDSPNAEFSSQLLPQTNTSNAGKILSVTNTSDLGSSSDKLIVKTQETQNPIIQNASKLDLESANQNSIKNESSNFSIKIPQTNAPFYNDIPSYKDAKSDLTSNPNNNLKTQYDFENTQINGNQYEKTCSTSGSLQLDNGVLSSNGNIKPKNEEISTSINQIETPYLSENQDQTQGVTSKSYQSESKTTYIKNDSANINKSLIDIANNSDQTNQIQDNIMNNKNGLPSSSSLNPYSSSSETIIPYTTSNPTSNKNNISQTQSNIAVSESPNTNTPANLSKDTLIYTDQSTKKDLTNDQSQNNSDQNNFFSTPIQNNTDRTPQPFYFTVPDNNTRDNQPGDLNQVTANTYPSHQTNQSISDAVTQQDKTSVAKQNSNILNPIVYTQQADQNYNGPYSTLTENTQEQNSNLKNQVTLNPSSSLSPIVQPKDSNSKNQTLLNKDKQTSLDNQADINNQTEDSIPYATQAQINKPTENLKQNEDTSSKIPNNSNDQTNNRDITGSNQYNLDFATDNAQSNHIQNQIIFSTKPLTEVNKYDISSNKLKDEINIPSSTSNFPTNSKIDGENNITDSTTIPRQISGTSSINIQGGNKQIDSIDYTSTSNNGSTVNTSSSEVNSGISSLKAEGDTKQNTSTDASLSSNNGVTINTSTGQVQNEYKNTSPEKTDINTGITIVNTSATASPDKHSSNNMTINPTEKNLTTSTTTNADDKFNNKSFQDVLINNNSITNGPKIKQSSETNPNIPNTIIQDISSKNTVVPGQSETKGFTTDANASTIATIYNQIKSNTSTTENNDATASTKNIIIRNAILSNILNGDESNLLKNGTTLKNLVNLDTTSEESTTKTNQSSQAKSETTSTTSKNDQNEKFLVSREVPEPTSSRDQESSKAESANASFINIQITIYLLILAFIC